MKINLLTSNQFKIETAKLAFTPFKIEVFPVALEIPEIQADNNLDIAHHCALAAAKLINEPVAREDHGFYLSAFPGWPGPYMAHTEQKIPAKDILNLLDGKDRTGYFEMALAYVSPDGKISQFSFQLPCTIAREIHPGNKDFGWDSIICLKDETRTLSDYPQEERVHFFTKNYVELAKEITKWEIEA